MIILFEAAEEALQTITPIDIAVVRRLAHPPCLIRQIMDCVLILFGRPLKNPIKIDAALQGPEPSWESSLKVCIMSTFVFHKTIYYIFIILGHV